MPRDIYFNGKLWNLSWVRYWIEMLPKLFFGNHSGIRRHNLIQSDTDFALTSMIDFLNFPQIVSKLTGQMYRHGTENIKVLVYQVQFLLEAYFLLKLIYPSLRSTTLPTLCIMGKLECIHSCTTILLQSGGNEEKLNVWWQLYHMKWQFFKVYNHCLTLVSTETIKKKRKSKFWECLLTK